MTEIEINHPEIYSKNFKRINLFFKQVKTLIDPNHSKLIKSKIPRNLIQYLKNQLTSMINKASLYINSKNKTFEKLLMNSKKFQRKKINKYKFNINSLKY